MLRHLPIIYLLFTLILGLFFCCSVANSEEKKILIVSHGSETPYSEVSASFKTNLKNATFVEVLADNAEVTAKITAYKPDLIFALGADAAELAAKNTKTIPIVATLLIKNQLFKTNNVTGVSLSYPLAVQLQWLKKFFPDQTKIAVLFNPAENGKTMEDFDKAATRVGFDVTAIPVESPKQMPFALEQLAQNVQVLFAIPDEVAMSPKTAKEVLLASFRNRVPLVGLSDNWVKSGALYALSWDYPDLGAQCALQSQRLLNGESVQKVSPETPRKVAYTVNSKIAEHLNIVLPASLLQNAKSVF